MKRLTINISDELFESLGGDKTKANKKALKLIQDSFKKQPTIAKAVKGECNHKLIEQIKGYLNGQDSVYLEVISNNHRRRSIRLKMDDL